MKNSCFLFEYKKPDGGGNMVSNPQFVVRRSASIGDAVAATVVAGKLKEQGYDCEFQSHPNIHAVLRFCPQIGKLEAPRGFCHVNLDGCYEKHPARRTRSFTDLYLSTANYALQPYGITLARENALAVLSVDEQTRAIVRARWELPRPWIFICPRSNSYIVRQVPDAFWTSLAPLLPGTKFWMGQHPAPEGFIDLKLHTLSPLVQLVSGADLIVSVDTGPAHIAIAQGIPAVLLGQSSSPELHFSDQRDFETVWPIGELDCLNCQQNICPKSRYSPPCQFFDVHEVARVVKNKLDGNRVAALIPTFDADAHMLGKTISNVAHQVDEVVITVAQDGKIPGGLAADPKVRIVRCPRSGLGFGKNVNFGMRHTSAPWVLLLNDDCYLNGDCVEQLLFLRAPGVGMIAHLLRYPNGQIYFAGRRRRPGERGFPHLNHRDYHPDISSISEMEAVSGTSVLINRKAFYQVGGFDERFFMYAEDDDISMRMRQAGYKLLYHPSALGIHEGSATTKRTGNMHQLIKVSGALMEKLWGWYWDKNRNTIPGVFK